MWEIPTFLARTMARMHEVLATEMGVLMFQRENFRCLTSQTLIILEKS